MPLRRDCIRVFGDRAGRQREKRGDTKRRIMSILDVSCLPKIQTYCIELGVSCRFFGCGRKEKNRYIASISVVSCLFTEGRKRGKAGREERQCGGNDSPRTPPFLSAASPPTARRGKSGGASCPAPVSPLAQCGRVLPNPTTVGSAVLLRRSADLKVGFPDVLKEKD